MRDRALVNWGGAHGVLEEMPRAPGLGDGSSGSLIPPGPCPLSAAAPRPGSYARPARGDVEIWVSLEGPPIRRLLSRCRVGGRSLFHPSLERLDLDRCEKTGRDPWSFMCRPDPFSGVGLEEL